MDQLQQRHLVRAGSGEERPVPSVACREIRDRLCRKPGPGVLQGLHPPEELGVGDDVGGEGVEEGVGDVPDVEEAEDVLSLEMKMRIFFSEGGREGRGGG